MNRRNPIAKVLIYLSFKIGTLCWETLTPRIAQRRRRLTCLFIEVVKMISKGKRILNPCPIVADYLEETDNSIPTVLDDCYLALI